MAEKIYTGYKDMYDEKIYEGDHLYNYCGESFYVTRSYVDENGEMIRADEPLLIDCVGDMDTLNRAILKGLSKNFNRVYNGTFC